MPPLVVPEEENEELNGYAKGVAEGVAARVQTGPLNVVGGDTKEVVEGGGVFDRGMCRDNDHCV